MWASIPNGGGSEPLRPRPRRSGASTHAPIRKARPRATVRHARCDDVTPCTASTTACASDAGGPARATVSCPPGTGDLGQHEGIGEVLIRVHRGS